MREEPTSESLIPSNPVSECGQEFNRRVQGLLESYSERFVRDFTAVEPPREKPTA